MSTIIKVHGAQYRCPFFPACIHPSHLHPEYHLQIISLCIFFLTMFIDLCKLVFWFVCFLQNQKEKVHRSLWVLLKVKEKTHSNLKNKNKKVLRSTHCKLKILKKKWKFITLKRKHLETSKVTKLKKKFNNSWKLKFTFEFKIVFSLKKKFNFTMSIFYFI